MKRNMGPRIGYFLLLVFGIILSILALYPGAYNYITAIIGFIFIIIAVVGLWKNNRNEGREK
jgi:uncharacterized membrane protein